MADFDLVIRNGTVATASDVMECDLGITGGRIAALGRPLAAGAREIDAKGLLVLPGGIDSHCHIDQLTSMGVPTADDFHSGTVSAACGGTTTIIPFAAQQKGQSLRAVVEDYRARARDKAVVDYAIHLIVSDPGEVVLKEELPALIKEGYTSFKVYMTYDTMKLSDRELLEVLAVARREGALVMVHAENHDVIAWLRERLLAAGHTAPRYHAVAQPMLAEREATHRAITLSEIADVPVLIVHVSGREAIEQIGWARQRGLRIYAETCTQYLVLTEDDLAREGFEGAKFICSPPPRDRINQEHVWRGLQTGLFEVVSSDHAPFRFEGPHGKKAHGENPPFTRIANGVPGLEARLPLLFSEGVGKGRIGLTEFVALSATNAARLYGLHPRKGTLAIGSDADIAIWNPEREVTLSAEMLHDNMDYTPFEGMKVRGWPVITLSRGEVVWNDGEVSGEPGRGEFLPCGAPEPARPRDQLSETLRDILDPPRR